MIGPQVAPDPLTQGIVIGAAGGQSPASQSGWSTSCTSGSPSACTVDGSMHGSRRHRPATHFDRHAPSPVGPTSPRTGSVTSVASTSACSCPPARPKISGALSNGSRVPMWDRPLLPRTAQPARDAVEQLPTGGMSGRPPLIPEGEEIQLARSTRALAACAQRR
jgi:hypothetical protein